MERPNNIGQPTNYNRSHRSIFFGRRPFYPSHLCYSSAHGIGPLGIATCWYLKTLKFALSPAQTPNVSRWNIGDVGFFGIGSSVGHAHFMLFVSLSPVSGSQHEHNFQ